MAPARLGKSHFPVRVSEALSAAAAQLAPFVVLAQILSGLSPVVVYLDEELPLCGLCRVLLFPAHSCCRGQSKNNFQLFKVLPFSELPCFSFQEK